ncbi:MAG: hypothetical protein QNJ63_03290 [Calothrix sp. MO_192.B10]|nr:hypothetical protein [Calothrix sp. MO_192.B10]
MRSNSYLLPWVITRVLASLSIGLTVACQSQPSSVKDSTVSPVATPESTQPSSNLPPTSASILSPTPEKPTTAPIPTPTPKKTFTQKPPKPEPIAQVPTAPSPKSPQKAVTSKSTNIYQNQKLGIKFEYPEGYTVDAPKEKKEINVWLNTDYQAIKSGKYQNTEPPSHLNISVEPNPQKLPAKEWVKANDDQFLDAEKFSNKAVAGKQALAFHSSALFDYQYIVIPTSDGNQMIVISIEQGDQKYQKALNRVTSSLEVTK